jgi:quercetin dioxygenase-like cupin family protein
MRRYKIAAVTVLLAHCAAVSMGGLAGPASAEDIVPPFAPLVAGPSIPVTLPLAGSVIDILVQSSLTAGEFSVVLIKDQPGGGPRVMIHTRETETFYVLEGNYEFQIGDKTYPAGPGQIVVNPIGVAHGFKVVGDKPGTLLVTYTPGGFEDFFLTWGRNGLDTPDKIGALEKDYGIVGSGVGAPQ